MNEQSKAPYLPNEEPSMERSDTQPEELVGKEQVIFAVLTKRLPKLSPKELANSARSIFQIIDSLQGRKIEEEGYENPNRELTDDKIYANDLALNANISPMLAEEIITGLGINKKE